MSDKMMFFRSAQNLCSSYVQLKWYQYVYSQLCVTNWIESMNESSKLHGLGLYFRVSIPCFLFPRGRGGNGDTFTQKIHGLCENFVRSE